MPRSQRRRPPADVDDDARPDSPRRSTGEDDARWLPVAIASAFAHMGLPQRARVLRRLLLPIGPMALAVLGGGVFAKYTAQARRPRLSLSLDDVVRVTAIQVYELVEYVQQCNPLALQHVLVVLARDAGTMAVLGASLPAMVVRHVASARPSHARHPT